MGKGSGSAGIRYVRGRNKRENMENAVAFLRAKGFTNVEIYPSVGNGIAYYNDGKISINSNSPYWRNPSKTQTPEEVLLHELGHAKFPNTGDNFWSLRDQNIVREVSNYSARNPKEFVASTYSGLQRGKKYSAEVMRLYRLYRKK